MVRRGLTRIELRMDDLQEYEQIKKQQEKRKCGDISDASFLLTHNIANLKSRVQQQRDAQHERIGYNPAMRNPQ